jgi:hypothetical protein
VAALLCSVAVPAPASAATVRSIIHRVESRVAGAIFAAHVRAAAREWKQLPPAELACADQALKERGQSVEALARKGVSPNHPRLAELRKQCADAAKLPAAAAREWKQLPPAELACADQALKERGESVEALARKGISPNHPRLAELRKQCADAAKLAAAGSLNF